MESFKIKAYCVLTLLCMMFISIPLGIVGIFWGCNINLPGTCPSYNMLNAVVTGSNMTIADAMGCAESFNRYCWDLKSHKVFTITAHFRDINSNYECTNSWDYDFQDHAIDRLEQNIVGAQKIILQVKSNSDICCDPSQDLYNLSATGIFFLCFGGLIMIFVACPLTCGIAYMIRKNKGREDRVSLIKYFSQDTSVNDNNL